jgi:3-dehydroquinate dehydratase type I
LTLKICVSISPKTVTEALDLIEKAESQHVDLIEIRLDRLRSSNQLADIAPGSITPLIATNRSANSLGSFSGSETERKRILLKAARNGFEYVDVELTTPNLKNITADLCEMGVKPIVSFHDFEGTPSPLHLNKLLEKELASGANLCKIVTTARFVEDNLTVLNFVSTVYNDARIVCFAMGDLGKPSRLLSPLFGASFTFASLESGKETASGQLTIQEIRCVYAALGWK